MLFAARAPRLIQSVIGTEILAMIAVTLSGCGRNPPIPDNVSATCTPWPSGYKYGCTKAGGDWQKLADKGKSDPEKCERLCGAAATEASCCYWSTVLGCWMKPGAGIAKPGLGLAVICRPEVTTSTSTLQTSTSTTTTTTTNTPTTVSITATTTTTTLISSTTTTATFLTYSECMEQADPDSVTVGVCSRRCLESMVADGFQDWSPGACPEADQDGNGNLDTEEEVALFCDCSVAADSFKALVGNCHGGESSARQEELARECKGKVPSSKDCRSYQLATNETYADKIFTYWLQAHCRVLSAPCACTGADDFSGDVLACSPKACSHGKECGRCSKYNKPYGQACVKKEKCVPPPAKKAAVAIQLFRQRSQHTPAGSSMSLEARLHGSVSEVSVLIAACLGAIIGGAISYMITTSRRPSRRGTPLLA